MVNVHFFNEIINKKSDAIPEESAPTATGRRLGTAYEQELEEKLYSTLSSKAELRDLNGKLVDRYTEREKELQRILADVSNKTSQLNASSTEVRSQLISERKSHSESQREIQSLKSEIKTLKRKATLAQKTSSLKDTDIASLKDKISGLEVEVEHLEQERASHDSDVASLKEKVSELDSLRLELEREKEDLNSKNYELDAEVGRKNSEINSLRAKVNELEKEAGNLLCNYGLVSCLRSRVRDLEDQLEQQISRPSSSGHEQNQQVRPHKVLAGRDNQYQSVTPKEGGAEVVSLPASAPIIASSLMSPLITYTILTLLLIAIIWIVVGKKIWNIWSAKPKEKSDRYIQTSDLHLRAYPRPGYMVGGMVYRDRRPEDRL
jgi:predicted  nucleic acid-binding Zn-ribbon protein